MGAHIAADEEKEDDEDELEEAPACLSEDPSSKARLCVSAEAYGEWNELGAFRPPVFQKTAEQKEFLRSILESHFPFSSLDDSTLDFVTNAFQGKAVDKGERLFKLGDPADACFVVEKGTLNCSVRLADNSEKVTKTCCAGDVLDLLPLLYTRRRGYHLDAESTCILWKLERETFRHILRQATQLRRRRHDVYLGRVPLLASLTADERSQVVDALRLESFDAGATIVKQGTPGHKFCLVEQGVAVAVRGQQEVMRYGPGDYFGEMTLLRSDPRLAPVTCLTPVRLASLEGSAFRRLLNVTEFLDRSNGYVS